MFNLLCDSGLALAFDNAQRLFPDTDIPARTC